MATPQQYASIAFTGIGAGKKLHMDEKVWSLYEKDEQVTLRGPMYGKVRRFQTIRIIRDGKLVEFTRDLGPSANFVAAPFAVMSLLEDSVGQVMDYADFMRGDANTALDRAMADHLESFDVVQAALRQAEQVQAILKANPVSLARHKNPKDRN